MDRAQQFNGKKRKRSDDSEEQNMKWKKFAKWCRDHRKEAPLTTEEREYLTKMLKKCVGNVTECSTINSCLDDCHPPMAFKTCKELITHKFLCDRLHSSVYNCVGPREMWFCHDQRINESTMSKANMGTEQVEWLLKPIAKANLSIREVESLAKFESEKECQKGKCIGALCLDPCHPILKFEDCDQLLNHIIKCKRIHKFAKTHFNVSAKCDGYLNNVAFHRFSNKFDLIEYIEF